MTGHEPLAAGVAQPLPVLGEGCLSRFDPEYLSEEHGAQFEQAQALWQQLQNAADEPVK